jgi:hypothetical protein
MYLLGRQPRLPRLVETWNGHLTVISKNAFRLGVVGIWSQSLYFSGCDPIEEVLGPN